MNELRRALVMGLMGGLIWMNTLQAQDELIQRPINPWMYQTELDGLPDQLIVALNINLFISYDPANCGLDQAWRGRIVTEYKAPDSTKVHKVAGFPFANAVGQDPVWHVRRKGKELVQSVKLVEYVERELHAVLVYELALEGGEKVVIEEMPEFVTRKKNFDWSGLERTFTVKEAPEDVQISLAVSFKDLLLKSDFKFSGKTQRVKKLKSFYDFGTLYDIEAELIMDAAKPSILRTFWSVNIEAEAAKRNQG
ncbi:hypothetical protein [Pontibacter sp. G13]|uniref:hypothetical protein n=1 Tax=Pontibacter sp. G13 TaxID=3074898 RepID=UPI00288B6386|nr:hypothetical protein [Pontibacter sp. G13]WNJ21247.1 hypothetical protein RJD25_12330 [Pontibacter sp. G13]